MRKLKLRKLGDLPIFHSGSVKRTVSTTSYPKDIRTELPASPTRSNTASYCLEPNMPSLSFPAAH